MGIRLNKVLKELNVSTETVVEFLMSKPGLEPTKETNPNTNIQNLQRFSSKVSLYHSKCRMNHKKAVKKGRIST